jgi:hypothetical protein
MPVQHVIRALQSLLYAPKSCWLTFASTATLFEQIAPHTTSHVFPRIMSCTIFSMHRQIPFSFDSKNFSRRASSPGLEGRIAVEYAHSSAGKEAARNLMRIDFRKFRFATKAVEG